MNSKFMNEVKNLIVAEATKNGVNLSDEFGRTEEFKNAVIAFTFKTIREMGFETEDAFDAIFGKGAYADLFAQLVEMA